MEIRKSLPSEIQISARTISRVLVDSRYRAYKAKIKPFLTYKHKKDRLKFADQFINFNDQQWSNVIFSDESKICLMASDKPPLVRRPVNSSLEEKYLRPSFKNPQSIMVWGCFSQKGLESSK